MKPYHHHHGDIPPSNIPLLTCALLAALTTGGPTYAFGLYSSELKEMLQLSQSQLDTLSSANFCAGLLTWIPGLLVDRYGVKFSLILGGGLGATFMTAYWAVARQLIPVSHHTILPTLCLLGVLIFMTNGLVIGSIFKLIVATCAPHTKGSAVGAAKGYVGLGSGVYACLFRALKTPLVSDLDFLPLAAILAVVAGSLPAMMLLPNKAELDHILDTTPRIHLDQTTAQHLRFLYVGLIGLASIVVGTTLASLGEDSYHDEEEDAEFQTATAHPQYGRALLVITAWIGPILGLLILPPKSRWLHDNHYEEISHEEVQDIRDIVASIVEYGSTDQDDDEEEDEQQPFNWKPLSKSSSSPALAYGAEITQSVQIKSDAPEGMLGAKIRRSECIPVPNFTLREMLQTTPAWLFLWIAIIRVGGGTMVTNNMGQMVESLHLIPMHTTTPASLALFSVAQAASRVITGAVSDSALSWNIAWQYTTKSGDQYELQGIPRPAFLMVASLAGVLAHVFLSLTTTRNFFLLGVCFSGAAFGMIWPLMVLIVGEVFGTANMGANYMLYDGISSAFGTLLLSKFVTQDVYERHIESEGSRTCFGQQCFFGAHIIIAILSFTCVLASYWFYIATRHAYARRREPESP
ncbi:Nodulin-like [Seminavis robusta]|uniref:Nodulin-like n=1 Tax=Seminavis robusta TaxID=568900 RepID=A0A9N8DTL3_9STRA|nr:Nodulin-like [Seminavis robusta]|eukprot:Sro269_g104100.1 Nodulin-like (634) ;mRNA; f:65943-68037